MQSDRLEVQAAIKVDRGDDVSLRKPIKPQGKREAEQGDTHCKVGTIPLTPCPSPGVAAGVVGVTPLPMFEASTPFCSCWPFGYAPPVA